ncbi:hypothetical protein C7S14_7275 [Burkholderia cepacia]|nr:hypothetical protein C7S14_7275 [Burkholderia cepacia]
MHWLEKACRHGDPDSIIHKKIARHSVWNVIRQIVKSIE